jgi:hypothetical protein
MGNRERKAQIGTLLRRDDDPDALAAILAIPARQAVGPLFAFFYSGDDTIRWRAISAMGMVVSRLADRDMEAARVVMRRLMWNLNDESGGIGWGSPEAMGDITARHAGLAAEFCRILISYIDPVGNYLEHVPLQRGAVWGVGRLAHARPHLVRPANAFLTPFFDAADATLRGTAIWAAIPLLDARLGGLVAAHRTDMAPLCLYRDMRLEQTTVSALAGEALAAGGR